MKLFPKKKTIFIILALRAQGIPILRYFDLSEKLRREQFFFSFASFDQLRTRLYWSYMLKGLHLWQNCQSNTDLWNSVTIRISPHPLKFTGENSQKYTILNTCTEFAAGNIYKSQPFLSRTWPNYSQDMKESVPFGIRFFTKLQWSTWLSKNSKELCVYNWHFKFASPEMIVSPDQLALVKLWKYSQLLAVI